MTISFRIDNYAFQRVKRSEFVNLPGRHWFFCQQDRHTGTPAIIYGAYKLSFHSWAVFDFLPISIGQCVRSQILVNKETAVDSETQRSFTAFSTFRKATKNNRSGPGFLFRFRPWRGLEFSSTQSVQRKTIAKVRIPNRARRKISIFVHGETGKLHSNHLTFPARLGCCVWGKLGNCSGVKPSMLHFWLFLPSRKESLAALLSIFFPVLI